MSRLKSGLPLLWLVALAPFLLFPGPIKALALLGLPLLWLWNKWQTGHFVRRTPFDASILVLLVMVLVSLYATFSLEFSLSKLTGLLLHIAIFYAVAETVQRRVGLNRSLWLYGLLGVAVTGLALFNTQWISKVVILKTLTTQIPVLLKLPGAEQGISPNQLAGTLLWLFPISIALTLAAWSARHHRRDSVLRWWLLGGVSLFLLAVFVLTQSRGGWIGGVVALVVMAAIWQPIFRWLVGVGVAVSIGIATWIGWDTVGDLLVSDTTEAVVGNLGSLGFRQEVWRAALWGLADFPFTGMGLGTFREVSRVLYPMNVAPNYDIAHAHNQFLQTGLDLGLLGLAAYVALWLGAAFLLWQTLRISRDPFIRAVAIGISGALAGSLVYGLSDAVALGAKPGFFWWWLLAFTVGVYQQRYVSDVL